jgi:restriction system protein
MWPSLLAARELGDSATVDELNKSTIGVVGLSEDQQAVPQGSEGRRSEAEHRLHWARTCLKAIGAPGNSAPGVWTVTDHGRNLTGDQMLATVRQRKHDLYQKRRSRALSEDAAEDEDLEEQSRKDILIGRLLALPPAGFERLARLLREAGFVNVTVTSKSGDGGIDGSGTHQISLVSFPVYFQSKRYKSVVTPSIVRDLRGAAGPRAEPGVPRPGRGSGCPPGRR